MLLQSPSGFSYGRGHLSLGHNAPLLGLATGCIDGMQMLCIGWMHNGSFSPTFLDFTHEACRCHCHRSHSLTIVEGGGGGGGEKGLLFFDG